VPSFLRSGYFALNYKDVLPQGFIDQYVTKTFQDEALRPQGSFLVNLFDGAVPAVGYSGKVYGKPMPWFRLIYTSSTEDIGPSDSNIDDPADPYPYKQYFIFVDYEYFNSQGVALGKKVTTKFTVNIVRDEERLQPNTSTVKWMLDDEDEVYFDIYPAPNSSISVENQSKVIGIEYFDPYFTSKIVRLLPASSMGVIVDYFYNLAVPIVSQNNFSSFAGFDLFGLASNQAAFDSLMGAKISKPVDYKWGLQLVNAKTVVNKEITITPQVFSTRGSLAADGVEIFYIPILSSDKGITKILCASKDMVDFNQSDLKVLGKGFVEVGMGDGGNSSEGIDEQKLKDAKPLGFAIVQNRELKKKYKSGSSIENFPQIGNNTQYMINSPLFVFNEDSVANGIYIFAPKNFLRSGDTIFVTYGQVDKHELRHVGQKRHIYFQQSGLGEFQVISSRGGQYEFKKFSFDVLSSHLENNIFIRNISGRNVDLANSSSSSGSSYDSNFNYKGYDSADFSRAADFSVATHLDWLSDNPENPISSSSSSSKNLEKFNCYRLTKVKLSPALYPSGLPANGYFVARSIGVSVQGVDYGPGIYHIDSFGNAKLLLSGSGVRDQEWWRSSFDSLGVYDVSLESERGQLEFVYDVSQLTNSYIVDDRKIPYEINFAKALSSVSKFSANCGENQGVSYPWISRNLSNIESSNTGVGICILDFININSLRTKIAGTDVFFSSNCRKYIDASNSVFDFSRSTNQVWGFELKQGLSGGSSGASIFSSVLYYFYYSPIEFNKNGRIIWEGIGPGVVQSTTIKVTTREALPPSIGGHFETSNLINGAVVVPSESDSSIRLFKCKSMVASDPKGDTKNARLSFPDSSYMESDFLNSFSDPRPSIYKWMPIDDAPFYSKGRRIMPKYYEYPNLNHSNYISKKIYGDLREFSSLKLKAQKYRYGFLGGSDQAGWSSKEPVIQTKNHLEILVEFDSRIEHMEITLKFSKSDPNINIGYVHIYFDDDDDKSNALFVPCKSLNSIGEYSIRFDFFANYNKRIKIIVPEKDLYPSSMLHVTSLIDESDYVEYRSTFLTSENFDISFSKTGFSIMFFTDTNEATLDACLFNNHDEMPRIIRSVFQSFGDEKVSFICCRNPPRQNNIFVMFQLDDTILLKTFDPNSLLYSEFDLMPVVNYNAFAYADILISANSEKRIVSLNPENYSKFQDNFAGITIKNKNYCNNFRISPAQFVHGNCKTELSSFIYAEANGEYAFSQLANQYSVQSGLNQASANYSQLSSVNVIRYLSNNDTFYPRFFDSASNIKFNRMLNSQRFSFEILNDGSIVLFMCNSGSLFIKIGSQGGAFRDITSDIYKFPDLVFDEFGLIPFRPVKFKKSEKGSKYTIENNSQNEIKSYLLQSAPEIEFVSSVYDDYSNTLYLFYIIENKLFYQYFNGYFLLNKNFINSMTTDTDFNEKSLPVYVCGSLGDLQDVIYTEECYFINPYIDYKDSIINFPISNVPPVGIVMPNGWIRVYVKDENDYLRSFSINGSRVIPDTFFSTSSAL
jgi:hypothetical protein